MLEAIKTNDECLAGTLSESARAFRIKENTLLYIFYDTCVRNIKTEYANQLRVNPIWCPSESYQSELESLFLFKKSSIILTKPNLPTL